MSGEPKKVTRDEYGPLLDLDAEIEHIAEMCPGVIQADRVTIAGSLRAVFALGHARGLAAGAAAERERCAKVAMLWTQTNLDNLDPLKRSALAMVDAIDPIPPPDTPQAPQPVTADELAMQEMRDAEAREDRAAEERYQRDRAQRSAAAAQPEPGDDFAMVDVTGDPFGETPAGLSEEQIAEIAKRVEACGACGGSGKGQAWCSEEPSGECHKCPHDEECGYCGGVGKTTDDEDGIALLAEVRRLRAEVAEQDKEQSIALRALERDAARADLARLRDYTDSAGYLDASDAKPLLDAYEALLSERDRYRAALEQCENAALALHDTHPLLQEIRRTARRALAGEGE